MKHLLWNHRLLDLLKQRNGLLALSTVLLGLNVLQGICLLLKDERVVILPPDVRQEVWMEQKRVSPSYLEEMAIFFADLILENTPSGAAYRRDIVLRHAAASGFGALKAQLLADEERLKKEHLSTSFQATAVTVNPGTLSADITGDLMRYVGSKRISQSRDTYHFQFTYTQGRLRIQSFSLVRSDKHGS